MEKFYGRLEELKSLEQEYNKKRSSLVVIYGRRRIGKSAIVKHFCHNRLSLQFDGLENDSTHDQIKYFKKCLQDQVKDPLLEDVNWTTWIKPLDYLTRHLNSQKKKIIIFFDEFQWMSCQQSKLTALLKSYWDNQWKDSGKVQLILCGSVSSFMVRKVIHSKALYGRINLELQVSSLPLHDAYSILSHKRSMAECLNYYLVFGGVPKYFESIEQNKSFSQNMKELCFSKNGEYLHEYEKIFYSQFRVPRTYERIISKLKNGPQTYSEIIKHLNMNDGGGAKSYLTNLEIAGFVQSTTNPFTNQEKRYFISDEYLRFFHKFIMPNRPLILKNFAQDIFRNKIASSWTPWLGLSFEFFCIKNAAFLSQIMGFENEVQSVGPYSIRNKNGKTEGFQIDLIYYRGDIITVCEIKYSENPIGIEVINSMKEKMKKAIPYFKNYYTIEYALVAPFGVTSPVIKADFFHHIVTLKDLFIKRNI